MLQTWLFCKSTGKKAIIFGMNFYVPGILIHGTIAPTSVYSYRSHDCIRVMHEHIEQFFEKVEINTPGELIYKPVKAAVSDQGRIYLEVHRDIYGKIKNLRSEALQVIGQLEVADNVNWEKVDTVLREKAGIAGDVAL
jgi:L,D-transpeptidase ErfK/SrfK